MKMTVFARNLRSLIAVHHDGNVSEAARALKINRTQLNRYLMEETWPREAQLRQLCAHFSTDARLLMEPLDTINAPAPAVTPHSAIADIAAERQRQIEAEGWTPEHDDKHAACQMALAAGCYAMFASAPEAHRAATDMPRSLNVLGRPLKGWAAWLQLWPWDRKWWKPTTPRRDLVKAGALIVAEIERIDRAALRAGQEGGDA